MLRTRTVSALLLSVVLLGCPDESEPGAQTDLGGVVDDAEGPSTDSPDPGAVPVVPDSGAATEDGGVPPDAPALGQFNEPCAGDADCESGFCVASADGSVCAELCVDCAWDWGCQIIGAGDVDIIALCMPSAPNLCRPCVSSAECPGGGNGADSKCVDTGPAGAFCGIPCTPDGWCRQGYVCEEVTTVEGASTSQCVLAEGECECSFEAIDAEASTTCFLANEIGTCTGARVCSVDGLSACDATQPQNELCNGIDDDCDGLTDEELGMVSCGVGPCEHTEAACANGVPNTCDATAGATGEQCNGLDDDCDGAIDEDFPDLDGDGAADCLDDDVDDDGIPNGEDNCPDDPNPDQADFDLDTIGDVCDPDDDDDLVADEEDCAPFDAAIFPGATGTCGVGACTITVFLCDASCLPPPPAEQEACDGLDDDCDGSTDEGYTDTDGDGAADCVDADDDNDGVADDGDVCPLTANPGQEDADGDGLGDACDSDTDGDGDLDVTDCAPADAAIHHGAVEACDGVDNDCDGAADEADAQGCETWLLDLDGDGFGAAAPVACLCAADGLFSTQTPGDCAPLDGTVHPDADELCNGVDDDCAGGVDDGFPDLDGDGVADCVDTDSDGDGDPDASDCAPADPSVSHLAAESCNGGDDDCDGQVDEAGAGGCSTWYADLDGDGYGSSGATACLCAAGGVFTAEEGGDCAPGDEAVHPGADEVCNGIDDDCVGGVDEGFADTDGDGQADCIDPDDDGDGSLDVVDCAPLDPSVSPAAAEVCNGVDDNCVGGVDEAGASGCTHWFEDTDEDDWGAGPSQCLCGQQGDFTAAVGGDCAPTDPAVNPGEPEVCNGVDDNCIAGVDEGFADTDGNGSADCVDDDDDGDGTPDSDDCEPLNPAVHPGAAESCNGVDDDCSGAVDDLGTVPDEAPPVRVAVGLSSAQATAMIQLPAGALDTSAMAPGGADLRVYDGDGAAVPFWVEAADPATGALTVWVGASSGPITLAWGDPAAASASDGPATFPWFFDESSATSPLAVSWTADSGPGFCGAVGLGDVTSTALEDAVDVFRPNQGAFMFYPDPGACFTDTTDLAVRARVRMLSDHFDRDLGAGFSFPASAGAAGLTAGKVAPSALNLIRDEEGKHHLQLNGECHLGKIGTAVEPTALDTGEWNTLELGLHAAGLTGTAAGDPDQHLPLNPTGLGACATPVVRGNTDSWSPGEIHFQIDWMHTYPRTAGTTATVCTDGAPLPLGSPTDDADGDGVADADDCAPLDPTAFPGADELCNGADEDCDGLVDVGCHFETDFSDPELASTFGFGDLVGGCGSPSSASGALTWSCPNNKGLSMYRYFPHADGHAIHIEVDITTSSWGDVGPRVGVQLLPEVYGPGDGFGSKLGYQFLISDPVDATQGGACPSDKCPSINKDGGGGSQLAVSASKIAPGVTYHLAITMDAAGITFLVSQGGSTVAILESTDTTYRSGFIGLFCAEATCAFDNLQVDLSAL